MAAQTSSDPIVSMRDASVFFEMDRGQSRVLNEVSIDIQRNEILGVVGESGSGKSMFASALLDAVVDPGIVSGEITYHPEDDDPYNVLDLPEKELREFRWENASMVFQGAMSFFNPTMPIRSHFIETLEAHDYNVNKGMEHANELLEELHLKPERVMDAYPHELSGGMKQRALIALSLVLKPDILVMDEPTAALDLLMQQSIIDLLENLQEKYELTIVFITHDLPLITDLCDRVAIMYSFELAEVLPIEKLTDSAHPYTRALLNAVPNLSVPLDQMSSIEGSSPDPVNIPEGCSYHPRCPLADEQCKVSPPALETVDYGHQVACFHHEDATDAIPIVLQRGADANTSSRVGKQSDEPILELNDIEVHFTEESSLLNPFDSPDTVRAVDGVDLDLYENDVVAIVGESGCGKTTLGKAAIGLQNITGGEIEYRGQDIAAAKANPSESDIPFEEIRRALQIIHQDPGSSLNPNRKISSVLQVPLKRWHPDLSPEDRYTRVESMLKAVGMSPPEDYAQRYPHQLSGGEQQRVALIRALLMNPDVILADEAVSALDVSLRVEMMDLMLELQDMFNTSYLFISHDLTNARYLAGKTGGRIGVMYLGEIVEIGPVDQIINDPKHPYTKALRWSTADLDPQKDGEIPIREIDVPDPVNPPSGCRFHTRCPEARETCRETTPEYVQGRESGAALRVKCFREYPEDHEYWDSEPLNPEPSQSD